MSTTRSTTSISFRRLRGILLAPLAAALLLNGPYANADPEALTHEYDSRNNFV